MLGLTDEGREALIRSLRDGIERDRFPLSPRLAPIRAILQKLEPASAAGRAQGHRAAARLAETVAVVRAAGPPITLDRSTALLIWNWYNYEHFGVPFGKT